MLNSISTIINEFNNSNITIIEKIDNNNLTIHAKLLPISSYGSDIIGFKVLFDKNNIYIRSISKIYLCSI
jgi:hypothetical protein